jgi:hypothetical protein
MHIHIHIYIHIPDVDLVQRVCLEGEGRHEVLGGRGRGRGDIHQHLIIGVVSVYMEYKCVYYCDTYLVFVHSPLEGEGGQCFLAGGLGHGGEQGQRGAGDDGHHL